MSAVFLRVVGFCYSWQLFCLPSETVQSVFPEVWSSWCFCLGLCFVLFWFPAALIFLLTPCVHPTPMWSSAHLRIWAEFILRFGGLPTFWVSGVCLPWPPRVPPSDASSRRRSSLGGLDRAGWGMSSVKVMAFLNTSSQIMSPVSAPQSCVA